MTPPQRPDKLAVSLASEFITRNEAFSGFVDYGTISTITGWSAFTTQAIRYHVIPGNIVFVSFYLSGTSNSTAASFTLPFAAVNNVVNFIFPTYILDNNVNPGAPGLGTLFASQSTVNLYTDYGATGWTASGVKRIQGEFTYVRA